jgi:hypothetical protein
MHRNLAELNAISLLKDTLKSSQFKGMNSNEKKDFFKIINKSRLEIYLYNFLKNNDLDSSKINEFNSIKKRSELYSVQSISTVLSTIHLNQILNDAKIEFIFLKGAHLLTRFYKDYSLRPTRDIDILVKPSDSEKVINTLLESGYKFEESFNKKYFKSSSQYGYDLPGILDPSGIRIEVHHRIESKVYNQKCKFSKEFYKNKKNYKLSSLDAYFLCDEDLIMHLIYHATKKQGPDVGLIFIQDLKQIFSNTALDLKKLIKKSKQYNIYSEFAYVIKIIDIFYDLESIKELDHMINIKINQRTLNSLKSLLINNKLNGQEFIMVRAIKNFNAYKFLNFYSISSITKQKDLSKNYFLITFFLMKRFFSHVMIFLSIIAKSVFYKKYQADLLKNINVIEDFRLDRRD